MQGTWQPICTNSYFRVIYGIKYYRVLTRVQLEQKSAFGNQLKIKRWTRGSCPIYLRFRLFILSI